MFYRLPGGAVINDDPSPGLVPQSVLWQTLFHVEDTGAISRVAPVFASAAVAVAWLRESMRELRKFPWYTRRYPPELAIADRYSIDNGDVGLSADNNYSGLADAGGFPIPTFLFRGQERFEYSLLPTLARCLWPAVGQGIGTLGSAVKVNEAEQRITARFVKKFFGLLNRSARRQFSWIKQLRMPRRAAIARHYGFYSWIVDHTVDPGIAAWFATGGPGNAPPGHGLGMISIIDEYRLTRLFGRPPNIVNYGGYQERSWSGVSMEAVHQNASVLNGSTRVGSLTQGVFWEGLARNQRELERMCVRLCYTPGHEVLRMWNQRWCGVEAICDGETWRRTITAYQIFSRITPCVLFQQNGKVYEEEGITAAHLLPEHDDFSQAVKVFKDQHRLNPGSIWNAGQTR